MRKYIFVYLGGKFPESPAESQQHFQKYQQWLQSLGDAVLNPAIPFKDTHTIHPDGRAEPGTMSNISGLSIIQFNSMQEALKTAQSCPFLEINGTLEVSEMVEVASDLDSANSRTIN